MSEKRTRSETTNSNLSGRDATQQHGQNYGGKKLDKTLSGVRVPDDVGPTKTPGGFGQVWRRRDTPLR